jgi:hypothetical protein
LRLLDVVLLGANVLFGGLKRELLGGVDLVPVSLTSANGLALDSTTASGGGVSVR